MKTPFKITVLTPEGRAYESTAWEVVASTAGGELGIQAKHTPLITVLKPGRVTIKKEAGEQHFAVSGGMLEVRKGGEVVVLADTAERAEDIDFESVEKAHARAEEALKRAENLSKEDFAEFQSELNTHIARLKLGKIFKK
ncbi:MAG: ATP synthase F1 subunit epsilon [Parcubacteria group bacterium]